MRRLLLIGSLLLTPSIASAQAVVRGVSLGATCTLTDSLLNPGGVSMSWVAANGRYEGSGNGMTYFLDRTGEYDDWAISLSLPAITSHGIIRQPVDLPGVSPLRWNGFVPTSGPFWRAYNYMPGISPLPYPFLQIRVSP